MPELNLLINYPKTKRKVKEHGMEKTEEDRCLARPFGQGAGRIVLRMNHS